MTASCTFSFAARSSTSSRTAIVIPTFQSEPFLADEAVLQKMLELFGLNQAVQNALRAADSSSVHMFIVASMRSCSHCFWAGSWMCMYSTPIEPQ